MVRSFHVGLHPLRHVHDDEWKAIDHGLDTQFGGFLLFGLVLGLGRPCNDCQ